MSWAKQPKKEEEIFIPEETKIFDFYKRIKDAVKRLEKEFADEYKVSDITAGISITASVPPSLTGSVSATLTKKEA